MSRSDSVPRRDRRFRPEGLGDASALEARRLLSGGALHAHRAPARAQRVAPAAMINREYAAFLADFRRVEQSYVDRLEADCDSFLEGLEKLRSFILPGGTAGAALLHQACTVVRRAERSTWAALAEHGDVMNPLTATYLNRLSDLLFILARYENRSQGDVLWVPGGERSEPTIESGGERSEPTIESGGERSES